MASGESSHATSVRILNENVDKLTKLPDMVKAFEELTNEEVILLPVCFQFQPHVNASRIVACWKLHVKGC